MERDPLVAFKTPTLLGAARVREAMELKKLEKRNDGISEIEAAFHLEQVISLERTLRFEREMWGRSEKQWKQRCVLLAIAHSLSVLFLVLGVWYFR